MSKTNESLGVVRNTLIVLALLCVGAHIVMTILGAHMNLAEQLQWVDLDNEWSIPAVYSGILWGSSAFMLLILSGQAKVLAEKLRWGLLAVLFLYIALDEQLAIHERFAEPLREVFSISQRSVLYHAWVLVAILIVLVIAGLMVFIRSKTKVSVFQKRILLYVALLAGGVIALEIIGTKIYISQLAYKLGPVLVEEAFEMSMISFILYKLTAFAFDER